MNQSIQIAFSSQDKSFTILIPQVFDSNNNTTDSIQFKKKFPDIYENLINWISNFFGTENLIEFVYNE